MSEENAAVPGLQFERTELSWQRVALAFLANGSLLVARHFFTTPNVLNLYAAAVAFALAALVAVVTHHRRLQLVQFAPHKEVLAAQIQAIGLAFGNIMLGVVVIALILLG